VAGGWWLAAAAAAAAVMSVSSLIIAACYYSLTHKHFRRNYLCLSVSLSFSLREYINHITIHLFYIEQFE